MLMRSNPAAAKELLVQGQDYVNQRWKMYERMAGTNEGGDA